jgi:Ni/Co efflux regulator RcnB
LYAPSFPPSFAGPLSLHATSSVRHEKKEKKEKEKKRKEKKETEKKERKKERKRGTKRNIDIVCETVSST